MTKTHLSLIFFFLSVITATTGQNAFGIKAGFNISDVRVNNPHSFDLGTDHSDLPGFQGGIFYEHFLTDNLYLLTELAFHLRGSQETVELNTPNSVSDRKLRFVYLGLPVMLGYRLGNLGIELGPEFSYRLDAYFDPENPLVKAKDVYETEFDLGIAGGINYSFSRVKIGLRYTYGLVNLLSDGLVFTDENGEPLDDQPQFYNHSLQLSLGYRLFNP